SSAPARRSKTSRSSIRRRSRTRWSCAAKRARRAELRGARRNAFESLTPRRRDERVRVNICVFCASASRIDPAYVDCAHQLGEWMGRRGPTLVGAGCNVGLMQEIGAAARAAGGRTVAVIPRFLIARGLLFDAPSETIATRDLAERKLEFRRLATAY